MTHLTPNGYSMRIMQMIRVLQHPCDNLVKTRGLNTIIEHIAARV